MKRLPITLMAWLVTFFFAVLSGQRARSDDTKPNSELTTVQRGLGFVQADAVKWRQEKKCSTCHHGTMTMWVQLEAKSLGFAVPPQEFQENVGWAKERILERVDLPRDTRPGWSMVNTPAIYLAIMAHAVPNQDVISDSDLKRIDGHLRRHQEENGAWMWSSAPPKNTPPPYFESDEVATRLTYLALAPRAKPDLDGNDAIRSSLARAGSWLQMQPPAETTQAEVLRLLMKRQAGAKEDELKSAIERLTTLQNSDGGWSQVKGASSDAYATGQVLYALNVAGVIAQHPAVRKAVAFLASTQRDDGSWPMKKRTHPGEVPTDNLVPITYFATAWATLGLMRSVRVDREVAP